ncbi:hypothetical protein HYH03_002497 [Edaphochlamys debaryana]|uniref:Uncharacterized protein n=1 Tax=Edaphochlamys debaryana TaxID=47281 RepID=A0A835YDD9_9CHLO|nr:hypothetical protein HYH03_002497 [Edaphochlamys debaryana]|eukprot:KAG2499552.1 hypothetical protein HYH03_002497 [Edaphochlamys debaryana]
MYRPTGSSSPTAAAAAAAAAAGAKPTPLTPYRHAGGPSSTSGGGPGAGAGHGPGGPPGPFRGPSPPLWDQALEQEKRLRSELRKKSFWDPDVRRLRAALQGTYEALLFGHYDFACAHDVEPCLWKAVFYKPIEEFRSRVRALEGLAKGAHAAPGAGGATPAAVLASPEEARAQLARTTSAYLRFLDDALAFYRKTVWKLQWVYGSVGASVDVDAALQNEIQECVPRAVTPAGGRLPDVRPSVHRCLIYLGDLCRYQSMALKERPTSARPLWERAMSYYRQAARVLPGSGNPYNQMAVMSYYTGDELRAVYYYFRSLAVALPFATARENLLLLFEKNRGRYSTIASAHAAAALAGGPDAEARAAAGAAADVSTRFVRLAGLLFDRINLEQLGDVAGAALRDLESFLSQPSCRASLQKAPEADQLLFHLAIMAVFAVHNVAGSGGGGAGGGAAGPGGGAGQAGSGGGGGGGYAAAAVRSELRCHAMAVALRFAAVVAGCTASMAEAAAAGGGVGDVEPGFGAVSTACHVMLTWMVANPQLVASPEQPLGGTGSGPAPPEVVAEVAARAAFLHAAARLAAHLSDLTRRRAHDQDWQDPAVRHRSLPEDSELVGFGPLAPVLAVAAGWPAAADAPSGGAAVLAVRVARMLQALRHLDDALGPFRGGPAGLAVAANAPSPPPLAAAPPTAAGAARELARAVRSFRAAMDAAVHHSTAAAPLTATQHAAQHGPGHAPGALQTSTSGGRGHAAAAGWQADPAWANGVHGRTGSGTLGTGSHDGHAEGHGHGHAQPHTGAAGPPHAGVAHAGAPPPQVHAFGGAAPTRAAAQTAPVAPPQPPLPRMLQAGGGGGPMEAHPPAATAAAAVLGRSQQQLNGTSAPAFTGPLGAAAAGSGGRPSLSANAGGGAGAAGRGGGGDAEEEDEIVYQPPRGGHGGGLPRPASVSSALAALARTSSGGSGPGPLYHQAISQDLRGILSKVPSGGGSSLAPTSHQHSRDTSRDGSGLAIVRSPSALSGAGGELHLHGAAAAAAAAPPPGLILSLGLGGGAAGGALAGYPGFGSSGLTSPTSGQGATLPPSPRIAGLEGAGSAGATGTGMLGWVPVRPPSPAVGELPGAGTIGLLQHMLHGPATGAGAGTGTGTSGSGSGGGGGGLLPVGTRRTSVGAPATLATAAGSAGTSGGRPGSGRRLSAQPMLMAEPAAGHVDSTSPHATAAATTANNNNTNVNSSSAPAAAAFAGLPASLQQRVQPAGGALAPQSLLAYGSGGSASAAGVGTFSGLPLAAAAGAGRPPGGSMSTLNWLGPGRGNNGSVSGPAGGAGGVGPGGVGGMDMSSFFAAAAGSYRAAALAEATAEATAVAMADDVLQAMDEDEPPFARPSAGGGLYGIAAAAGGSGPGGLPAGSGGPSRGVTASGYNALTGDYMVVDGADRFSPAVAAAAAGGGGIGRDFVTREPSAASDGIPAAMNLGSFGGGGGFGHNRFGSSGSGSGHGVLLAAAAAAASRGSMEGFGGSGSGVTPHDASAAAAVLSGFGSWGVVPPALPEHLNDFHNYLRRSAPNPTGATAGTAGTAGTGSGAAAAALLPPRSGSAAAPAAEGYVGEDLSCLSFLAAQLQAPAANGTGGGAGGQQGWAGQQG